MITKIYYNIADFDLLSILEKGANLAPIFEYNTDIVFQKCMDIYIPTLLSKSTVVSAFISLIKYKDEQYVLVK